MCFCLTFIHYSNEATKQATGCSGHSPWTSPNRFAPCLHPSAPCQLLHPGGSIAFFSRGVIRLSSFVFVTPPAKLWKNILRQNHYLLLSRRERVSISYAVKLEFSFVRNVPLRWENKKQQKNKHHIVIEPKKLCSIIWMSSDFMVASSNPTFSREDTW